ncbi:hypothetical protein ABZ783_07035 [Micromonospora sp. NPDC047738]|uniref:hypothetical protein n=1 Tax=Micromonospora sp. NPDC047738 TaxID=3155741 RepID=UPI0033CCA235
MYTGEQLDATFETGYRCGELNGRKNSSDLDRNHGSDHGDGGEVVDVDLELMRRAQAADPERFRQLAEACGEGIDAVQRLAREWGVDDLLDVADAAGVTPLGDVDPGQVVVEIEAWLRERGRGE